MKNSLIHLYNKILLRKRALAENICDELKNNLPDGSQVCQIEQTRNRNQKGFIFNLISGLIAYSYIPKKPSLNLEIINQSLALEN